MTKFTKWKKVTKNNLTNISKPHAHPHTMPKTPAKFQDDRYKTVRGVALTRHPSVNVDGWTNGWTNEQMDRRKLARLSRPC